MFISRRNAMLGLGTAAATLGFPAILRATETATIAYGSTGYTWALMFLAEAENIWERHGVQVEAVDFPTGRESMQALLGGSAEFATATDTPVVFAALQGLEPIILASYSRYSRDMMIAMGPNSGAVADDPSSLKGKTIATRVGTSGQYMLSRYLTMAGLSDSDVNIVDLSPNDMMSATMRGDVDGFSWTSQAAGLARQATNNAIYTMTQEGLEEYFVSHQLLLTNRTSLNTRAKLMRSAIRVLLETEQLMASNDEWSQSIAERVRAEPDFIEEMTSVFEFSVRLDQKFLDEMVTQAEWAIESGLSKDPGTDLHELFRNLIAEGPLREVAPERVSL